MSGVSEMATACRWLAAGMLDQMLARWWRGHSNRFDRVRGPPDATSWARVRDQIRWNCVTRNSN